MLLRTEVEQDYPAIHELVSAAFGQFEEADLVDRLRADGDSEISLVAVDGGEIVGHVLFSRLKAPFRALGLAPVAVTAALRRRGIGSRLIQEGLGRAALDGWRAVFIVGDTTFYARFGFDPALTVGFASPYSGPNFMVKPLNGDLPARTGVIEFPPAFSAIAD